MRVEARSVSGTDRKSTFTDRVTSGTGVVDVDTHTCVDTGAGPWAEFGPLYNGISWDEAKCAVIPSVCSALRGSKALCGVNSYMY